MLLKSQLRWPERDSRMKDYPLLKIVLYGRLSTGNRGTEASKRRYKESLKKFFSTCHIDHSQWSTVATDRGTWRHIIHQAVLFFGDSFKINLREKRRRRKYRIVSAVVPDVTFNSSHCDHACLSRIGLVSHKRACCRHGKPLSYKLRLQSEAKTEE